MYLDWRQDRKGPLGQTGGCIIPADVVQRPAAEKRHVPARSKGCTREDRGLRVGTAALGCADF